MSLMRRLSAPMFKFEAVLKLGFPLVVIVIGLFLVLVRSILRAAP